MVKISHGMTEYEWKMFNHQKKKDKIFEQNRFYCKCGHSISIMPKTINTICSNCGHLVFRDKELQDAYDREIEKREKKMKFKKELRKHL